MSIDSAQSLCQCVSSNRQRFTPLYVNDILVDSWSVLIVVSTYSSQYLVVANRLTIDTDGRLCLQNLLNY